MSVKRYNRYIYSDILDSRESLFVFGPRQTGKTTFLREAVPNALYIDLLNSRQYRFLGNDPSSLLEMISAFKPSQLNSTPKTIIIDEVQKLPELLNTVQEAMFRYPELKFLMTGSSPRKLRKAGVNLLGGRAGWLNFHGITSIEATKSHEHSWRDLLQYGSLPNVLATSTKQHAKRSWKNYLELYLKEEVLQEGLVRNLPAFSRFLTVAGFTSGQQVVFEKIGSDNQINSKTVRAWYEILEDTLLGTLLPCFQGTHKRKSVSSAKFYLFDVGMSFFLKGQSFPETDTPSWGDAFEHFVFSELQAYLDVYRKETKLSYWRSQSGFEVDFVLGTENIPVMAIEVKAKSNPGGKDFKGLLALKEEFPNLQCYVVCTSPFELFREEQVGVVPAEVFLRKLWSHEFEIK